MLTDKRKLTDLTYCALDLETTGTNPVFHRIVEIGMVRFSLDRVHMEYGSFVNPGMSMPEKVIPIHGITDDMVSSAPGIEDLLHEIVDFMSGSVLVIQNPAFDLAFLYNVFRNRNEDTSILRSIDTVRLSKSAFPSFPNHKLNTLCDYLDIPVTHHRALSDARACMEVFRRAVQEYDQHGSWRMSDLGRVHGKYVVPKKFLEPIPDPGIFRKHGPGASVHIRYAGSDGIVSDRIIVPGQFFRYGKKKYVCAYCCLRKENRYFNLDSIIRIF